MSLQFPARARPLIASIRQLHQLGLHRTHGDDCPFLLELPGEPHPAVAALMGQGGITTGLMIWRGAKAWANYQAMFNADDETVAGGRLMRESSALSYAVKPLHALDKVERRVLKQIGVDLIPNGEYPSFICLQPGKQPKEEPSDAEAQLLAFAVGGILKAHQDGVFKPRSHHDHAELLALAVTGDAAAPAVRAGFRAPPAMPAKEPAQVSSPAVFKLSGLPRLKGAEWVVALHPLPARIEGNDALLDLLVVLDPIAGRPVGITAVEGATPAKVLKTLADICTGTLEGPGPKNPAVGIPESLVFLDAALLESLRGPLAPLGIRCGEVPPKAKQALRNFLASIADLGMDADTDAEEAQTIPAPDDLQGWKQVSSSLVKRFARLSGDGQSMAAKPIKKYFGKAVRFGEYMEEFEDLQLLPSYMHWFVLHYRPTAKAQTVAETWLAQNSLPPAERLLLCHWMESAPSFHRITRADPKKGTVEMEDLLSGRRHTIHDQGLSGCAEKGWILTGWAHPAGHFSLYATLGPIFDEREYGEMTDWLEREGVILGKDTLPARPEVFGWLWRKLLDMRRNPVVPVLCNMDGDLMENHVARFTAADMAVVARKLEAKRGVEWDEDDRAWVWNAKSKNQAMDTVVKARFFEETGGVRLEANSRKRYDDGRKVLEKIPGVVFASLKTEKVDEAFIRRAQAEKKKDAKLPPPPSKEQADALREHMQEYYAKWLDMALPMLGDHTPRQAAKLPALRGKAEMLIRGMPDPTRGVCDFEPMRRRMLEELGMD